MLVMKFGGTSVGSAAKLRSIPALITDSDSVVVVLSAMAGTTNALIEMAGTARKGDVDESLEQMKCLKQKYIEVIDELFETEKYKNRGLKYINIAFDNIAFRLRQTWIDENEIVAAGELLSTGLFYYYMRETGTPAVLLPATEFMRINTDGEPDYYYISRNLKRYLTDYNNNKIYITQGFICRNYYGKIDNLGRGGSDYTAAIIGNIINSDEVQIWTDIDGIHNNDPRFVENTSPIRNISFDEAAELAYFGAKILHPATIYPCSTAGIPVVLKNTMLPADAGTRIGDNHESAGIKAIAAKDGITVIKIKSLRMLMAYGFLNKIFEIFADFKTPIDVITTSEVSVSLTIDNTEKINEIIKALEIFSVVETEYNQSIVCVVGDFNGNNLMYINKIFNCLHDIPVKMISYGCSDLNVSFIVDEKYKVKTLNVLHNIFLN